MIHFVAQDMEPLEVVVDSVSAAHRRDVVEPLIVALSKPRQRLGTNLLQPTQVVIQLAPSDLTSSPLT
jgi:hypothetical protein